MEDKKDFGRYVHEKRSALGLSQRELGDRLGVTVSAVSKWERGVSYPDITMIEPICRTLGVSEHELITASDDWRQRQLERDARMHQRGRLAWLWGLAALYAAIVIGFLVVDLGSGSFPVQSFVALASCALCASLTHVPLLAKHGHRGIDTLVASWAALQLTTLAFCVRDGGNWFFVSLLGTTLAYWMIFSPAVMAWFGNRQAESFVAKNRELVYLAVTTVLIFAEVAVTTLHDGQSLANLGFVLNLTALMFVPVWGIFLVLRYLPAALPYRVAAAFAVFGAWTFCGEGYTQVVSGKSFTLHGSVDLLNWSDYVVRNDNIAWICLAICLVAAVVLCVVGAMGNRR